MPTIMRRCYMLFILMVAAPATLQAGEVSSMQLASANPCNPCSMKMKHNPCNPCAMKKMSNPCGMKNPCNPCGMKMKHNPCNPCGMKMTSNPCGMKHNPCNPCGMKKTSNPCGMKNPCAGSSLKASDITRPYQSKPYRVTSRNHDKIAKQGKALWNDPKLSSNGLSCQSCHMQGANFNKSYTGSYPHRVEMVSAQAGISSAISAEQMVQFCMVVPMAAKPLGWGSRELAALTTYVEESSQPAFAKMSKANPCGMKMNKNPCGMKMAKNPCGMKHNPCGMKHNPCGMKRNPCGK